MKPIAVLIKPVSDACNMRCRYCFYADVSAHRETQSFGRMDDGTMEALIRRVLTYTDGGAVSFAFQGGEPTLAGADYYERFTALVTRLNARNAPISYSIQTNGYALSDALYAVLKKHRFLVGVSLDGTAAMHDAARVDMAGNPTFKRVNETIARLHEMGIEYNILTVLTNNIAKNIASVYGYFRSRRFQSVQFIKHIDGFGDCNTPTVHTLSPKRYASFLHTAFGYYYDDIRAGRYMSVREFDNFVRMAAGYPPECCGMAGFCPPGLVIEADGSVYPCDFYVLDEWKMGTIRDTAVDALLASDNARRFAVRSHKIDETCRTCRWVRLCRGGCARYREPADENGLARNRYCESYRSFFEQNSARILALTRYIR